MSDDDSSCNECAVANERADVGNIESSFEIGVEQCRESLCVGEDLPCTVSHFLGLCPWVKRCARKQRNNGGMQSHLAHVVQCVQRVEKARVCEGGICGRQAILTRQLLIDSRGK